MAFRVLALVTLLSVAASLVAAQTEIIVGDPSAHRRDLKGAILTGVIPITWGRPVTVCGNLVKGKEQYPLQCYSPKTAPFLQLTLRAGAILDITCDCPTCLQIREIQLETLFSPSQNARVGVCPAKYNHAMHAVYLSSRGPCSGGHLVGKYACGDGIQNNCPTCPHPPCTPYSFKLPFKTKGTFYIADYNNYSDGKPYCTFYKNYIKIVVV